MGKDVNVNVGKGPAFNTRPETTGVTYDKNDHIPEKKPAPPALAASKAQKDKDDIPEDLRSSYGSGTSDSDWGDGNYMMHRPPATVTKGSIAKPNPLPLSREKSLPNYTQNDRGQSELFGANKASLQRPSNDLAFKKFQKQPGPSNTNPAHQGVGGGLVTQTVKTKDLDSAKSEKASRSTFSFSNNGGSKKGSTASTPHSASGATTPRSQNPTSSGVNLQVGIKSDSETAEKDSLSETKKNLPQNVPRSTENSKIGNENITTTSNSKNRDAVGQKPQGKLQQSSEVKSGGFSFNKNRNEHTNNKDVSKQDNSSCAALQPRPSEAAAPLPGSVATSATVKAVPEETKNADSCPKRSNNKSNSDSTSSKDNNRDDTNNNNNNNNNTTIREGQHNQEPQQEMKSKEGSDSSRRDISKDIPATKSCGHDNEQGKQSQSQLESVNTENTKFKDNEDKMPAAPNQVASQKQNQDKKRQQEITAQSTASEVAIVTKAGPAQGPSKANNNNNNRVNLNESILSRDEEREKLNEKIKRDDVVCSKDTAGDHKQSNSSSLTKTSTGKTLSYANYGRSSSNTETTTISKRPAREQKPYKPANLTYPSERNYTPYIYVKNSKDKHGFGWLVFPPNAEDLLGEKK